MNRLLASRVEGVHRDFYPTNLDAIRGGLMGENHGRPTAACDTDDEKRLEQEVHTDPESVIELKNVSIKFAMSYDKLYSLRDVAAARMRAILKGTERTYFYALHGIDFTARRGDVLGIVGPNGSGKTTFLRVVSGIYEPDAGTVETHGRISALLTLGTGFNLNLSGYVNIRLSALLAGMRDADIEGKIDNICAFAELGEFIHVPMKYYSNGMISRLNFAIIVALEPEIVLVDEIFSVGDLAFQEKSKAAMEEMLAKAKCQLIATHNLSLVEERCNRAILFHRGNIIMDGSPKDVVSRYRDSDL